MDVRRLETFVTVASHGSFTRGATELHTVQSAVSATIKALERELGVALFDRTLRQIRLTPHGEALLPAARDVLDAVRAAHDAVDAVTGEVTGSLAFGYMTSVNLVDIPSLLREYSRRHPLVDITLRSAEHGTAGLIEMLRTGELDVALVAASAGQDDLDVVPVARSPLRLTVPAGHRLAQATSVGLDALVGEKFIEFRDGYGVRSQTDAAFAEAGVRRRVAFEVMDIAAIAAFVDNGLGIAFLPDFVTVGLEHTAVVPLQVELADMVVSVATRKNRPLSAAAHALRALILEPT